MKWELAFYSAVCILVVACNDNASAKIKKDKNKVKDTTAKQSNNLKGQLIEYLIKDINHDNINDTLSINSSNKNFPILTISYSSKIVNQYSTFSIVIPVNSCYDGSDFALWFQKENDNIKRTYDFSIYMFTWGKHDNKLYFDFSKNRLKLICYKYKEWETQLYGFVKNGKKIVGNQTITKTKSAKLDIMVNNTLDTEIIRKMLSDDKNYPFTESKKFDLIQENNFADSLR